MSAGDRSIHNASCENHSPWVFSSQVWHQLIFCMAATITGHSIYNAIFIWSPLMLKWTSPRFVLLSARSISPYYTRHTY